MAPSVDWTQVFDQSSPEIAPANMGAGPINENKPHILNESTRKWIADLTPEKISRLEELDKWADSTDLTRLSKLADLGENLETVGKFWKWAILSTVGVFAFVVTAVTIFRNFWEIIREAFTK